MLSRLGEVQILKLDWGRRGKRQPYKADYRHANNHRYENRQVPVFTEIE
jgi:hypothetical protein